MLAKRGRGVAPRVFAMNIELPKHLPRVRGVYRLGPLDVEAQEAVPILRTGPSGLPYWHFFAGVPPTPDAPYGWEYRLPLGATDYPPEDCPLGPFRLLRQRGGRTDQRGNPSLLLVGPGALPQEPKARAAEIATMPVLVFWRPMVFQESPMLSGNGYFLGRARDSYDKPIFLILVYPDTWAWTSNTRGKSLWIPPGKERVARG